MNSLSNTKSVILIPNPRLNSIHFQELRLGEEKKKIIISPDKCCYY